MTRQYVYVMVMVVTCHTKIWFIKISKMSVDIGLQKTSPKVTPDNKIKPDL